MSGPHDGRYAPSPSGDLHLGNLRTALVAWLVARGAGGRFLLRVDDIDPDRSRREHEHAQVEDLRSLGIDWDGEPIRQSSRLERYREAIRSLLAADLAYPCFCSRAEVRAAASAPHGSSGAPYPGTCARLSRGRASVRAASGEAHSIRVRAESAEVGFDDLQLGRVDAIVDDFVVRRRDGVPAYNLASPVDESDLEVGEVVRGADLAPTTPRQLWLANVLELDVPRFTHVPLVLGPDGTRLAKRHGDASLGALAELGFTSRHVLELLARSLAVAHEPGTVARARDLLDGFDRARIPGHDVTIDLATLGRSSALRIE